MNKLKKALKRLWQDESGQGAMEYILILVVVGTIVFIFKDKIQGIVTERTTDMGNRLRDTMGKLGPGSP